MKRNLTILVTLMLLLIIGVTTSRRLAAETSVEDSATSVQFPVVFVGNHVVDLQWTQVTDAVSYIIERDGSPIATLDPTTTFYRDAAAPDGTHTYTLYYVLDSDPVSWGSHTITLGKVQGFLYQDLIWSEGVYDLAASLIIKPGVTLLISPGVTVTSTSQQLVTILVQGVIEANGAQLGAHRLRFQGVNSTIQDSSITCHDLEFIDQADVLIEESGIKCSDIWVRDSATVLFNQNKFTGDLQIEDQAQVTLYRNKYVYYGWLYITGSPQVTLTDNFLNYVDIKDVGSTAEINVDNNIMHGPILISDGDTNANVTITSNNFAAYGTNISVTGDSGTQISLNCFSVPNAALNINTRTTPLNASNNWWGDVSGPEHPLNPGGSGGRIVGDSTSVVNFNPWIDAPDDLTCGIPDLYFRGFFVQQTVRPFGGEIPPLVAEKPSVLVYYARTTGTTHENVLLRVTGSRDNVTLGTVEDTIPILDLIETNGYIRLPNEWLTGTLTLEVTLNPDHTIDEVDYDNNTKTQAQSFTPKKPLRIAYVPINYQPDGGDGTTPNIASLPQMHGFLQQIYPVSHIDYVIWSTLSWPLQMNGHDNENTRADLLLGTLTLKLAIFNASRPADEQIDQIVGVFPSGATSFASSDPPWADGQGTATFSKLDGYLLAHEIGHNLDLYHPDTHDSCGAEDADTDWPYDDATIHGWGYDMVSNKVIPYSRKDIMTYCEPNVWISPFHYGKLFNQIDNQPQMVPLAAPHSYLLASGTVHKDGTVEFAPFWQVMATTPPTNPPAGSDYCLELHDGGGTALQDVCFNLNFYNHETYQTLDVDSFLVSLPLDGATTQVVLKKGAAVVGQMPVSAHPPIVSLLTPKGGQLVGDTVSVSWAGSDADGDDLAYNLSFSADEGLTWIPVALNLTGTTYELDLRQLPGSKTARLKIEVSDGFHTSVDQMDTSFTVTDRSPLVGIYAPVTGAAVTESVTLWGYAYDPEEGELAGTSLVWSSDQDGVLGTGSELLDVVLSSGVPNTLTLTGTDSKGHVSSESIVVNGEEAIAGLTVLNSSPTAPGSATMLTASIIDGSNVTYSWDFGDGESGDGVEVSHIYAGAGIYRAKVTAKNSMNAQTATTTVIVGDGGFSVYLPLLMRP